MDLQLWGIVIAPYLALLGMIQWDATRDGPRDLKLVTESLLTVALILVTAGQLAIAQRQAAIMDKQTAISAAQTRISLADERPWIRPTIAKLHNIVVDAENINLGVDFNFKNFGKSPAIRVAVHQEWGPQSVDRKSKQQFFCKIAESAMSDYSPTIYPNEDGNYTFGFPFTGSAKAMDTPWGNGSERYVVPEIVGCIAYRTAIDDVVHHTRFTFAMRRRDGEGVQLIPSVGPQTINAADIIMRYSPYGYNDAD